ncbi:disease resistance protein [Tanacetum coccineum]
MPEQLPSKLSSAALAVLTTRPACYLSLVSCLSSLGESLPSVPDATHHMPVGRFEVHEESSTYRYWLLFTPSYDCELGNLNLLGWELMLSKLENVGGLRDAKSANLKDKTNLKSLRLYWSWTDRSETFDSEVVEGLEPSSGLQELTIDSYTGTVLSPTWLVKLVNLTSIHLTYLLQCEQFPPLGKLPSLKRIELHGMMSLKCFHDDDDAASRDEILFPSLQEFDIDDCSALVSLPSNFPKLVSLSILEANVHHILVSITMSGRGGANNEDKVNDSVNYTDED